MEKDNLRNGEPSARQALLNRLRIETQKAFLSNQNQLFNVLKDAMNYINSMETIHDRSH